MDRHCLIDSSDMGAKSLESAPFCSSRNGSERLGILFTVTQQMGDAASSTSSSVLWLGRLRSQSLPFPARTPAFPAATRVPGDRDTVSETECPSSWGSQPREEGDR